MTDKKIIKTADIRKIKQMPNGNDKKAEATVLAVNFLTGKAKLDGALTTILEFEDLSKFLIDEVIDKNTLSAFKSRLAIERLKHSDFRTEVPSHYPYPQGKDNNR